MGTALCGEGTVLVTEHEGLELFEKEMHWKTHVALSPYTFSVFH
jgi:hypothetical protein